MATKAAGRTGPYSTGAMEEFLRHVGRILGDRGHGLTNKARADALLTLLAAAHNDWADEVTLADIIREHLTARRGHAPHQRRRTDPAGRPSLR